MIFCLAVWREDKFIGLLAILVALSYGQIEQIAKKSENVTARKTTEIIKIVQILKQQQYQTAIAERTSSGERIFLTWQSETPLVAEADYWATLNLRPISSRLNQGNFDRQKWYFAQNLQAIASVKQAELLNSTEPPSLRAAWLYRVKQQTEHLSTQGLLLALAFGERAWLKEEDWAIFQQTATAHLIAISGLHIALAFGLGFIVAKGIQWLLLRLGYLQAGSFPSFSSRIVGLVVALGYSFLAGFAIPTVRALIAISLVMLCQWCRRYYTAWQLWWRTVALLLLLDPISLLSDSFWLSILAVASLIFWYQYFPLKQWGWFERSKKSGKFARLLISLLHLQIGIWLVFSPVQLFFFGGASLFSLPANLLIVPLYSLILVPLILLSLLSDNFLQTWQLADGIAQASLWLINPLSDGWFWLSYSQQWCLLLLNFAILLLIYGVIWQKPKRYWAYAMILLLLFERSKPFSDWLSPLPQVEWINFDVGQGLAMALVYRERGQKRAIFYDTGASWQGGSMAEIEILPYLRREGIVVEAIFVSHEDNDHRGGVEVLRAAFPQAILITSSQRLLQQPLAEPCIAGKTWQFGELRLRAIFPSQLAERANNANSCVIVAEVNGYRLLFTGDSGAEQERQYAHQIGQVDFLQVGHHGSRSSTSQTLLAHIQPRYAVISAGRWNVWKHPNTRVIERLHQQQITVLNTAKVGMVKVSFYVNGYQIQTTRTSWGRWYSRYIE